MLFGLAVIAIVAVVLCIPTLLRVGRTLAERRAERRAGGPAEHVRLADPGRERRAEQRARELLRSCVNEEEWDMYRDLGFIRVSGSVADPGSQSTGYAYLIYPQKPIVAYVPKTRKLLAEYCVEFPDMAGGTAGTRLPDSDDVLAKWMALTGDERRLIADANLHLPGRQVDPGRVDRDLWRLSEWERQRSRRDAGQATL
jgi:hypothetical protein